MRASRALLALAALLSLPACAADSPATNTPYRYAVFLGSCAPWDGPALAFIFTAEKESCSATLGRMASFTINRDLPTGPGRYKLKKGGDAVNAYRCRKPGDCDAADAATLNLKTYAPGKDASGRYRFEFKDGSIEEGAFKAQWCNVRAICG